MSGFFAVIDPEQKTNLVCNPSAETTGNYAPIGATVSQSYDQARWGIRSWKVVTGATSQGLFLALTTATNTTHYASWYAFAVTGTMRATMNSGTNWNTAAIIGGKTGGSVRWGVAIPPAQATGANYVGIIDTSNDGTFYVDAVQVEAGSYPTTYIDGDMDGLYRWNGLRHASSSTRDAQERSGGKERDLYDEYGITVMPSFSGVGMPPVRNNWQSMALQPGALFQSYKLLPREIVLDMNVNAQSGATWASLHQKRQALINLIKPDRVRGAQPFTLRYTGTDRGAGASPLYAKFVYQSGLEFGNIQSGYVDKPGVRCVAGDPAWYEDNQQVITLGIGKSVTSANGILYRGPEGWTNLGDGVTGPTVSVWTLALDKNQLLYAGGTFINMGGVANTTHIAKWDGANWGAVGSGMSGPATVYTLCVGPDNALYAGGTFTTAGGVANTSRIAKWNGTAWSALGIGTTNGTVRAIVAGKSGEIYAGGTFINMGGVANTTGIAKWDGSNWESIGYISSPTPTPAVYALAVDKDGALYAGGHFNTIGGIAANDVAKWNGSNWVTLSVGVLTSDYPYGVWDRGLNFVDNLLYLSGAMTTAGGMTVNGAVAWNGSTFLRRDIIYPPPATPSQIIGTPDSSLYSAFNTTGTAWTSQLTTVVPSATKDIFPRIIIVGPTTAGTTARLEWIENKTTDETLYFEKIVQGGEQIVLDFGKNKKTVVSDWNGTVYGQPLSGSDFAAFHLLPTTNTIVMFMTGQVTTTSGSTAILQYVPAHNSLDGAA
jgi:hypothetical protein